MPLTPPLSKAVSDLQSWTVVTRRAKVVTELPVVFSTRRAPVLLYALASVLTMLSMVSVAMVASLW